MRKDVAGMRDPSHSFQNLATKWQLDFLNWKRKKAANKV
jgi:hypothetical protein